MKKNSTEKFYDELSSNYHLIFSPWTWDENIKEQANILDYIIKKYSIKTETILDCSCWIWTQSIWLAKKGYILHATDLSPKAIDRAIDETKKRGLSIIFWIADFRKLEKEIDWTFDTVISCDNSLPHLLDDKDLLLTAKNILTKMKSKSLFIWWIRDYNMILEEKIQSTTPNIKNIKNNRIISFQVWDWGENNTYVVNQFLINNDLNNDKSEVHLTKTKYRAYKREEITNIFKEAGFQNIKWLMQEESWYHQPLIIAYKK